ncbi:glutamate receptor ionotropic, kainate 5 [Anabrus simplex]|uniref:glutamate receptor ionotropic, kainate 5 n=1 Tax=Anabrus simplex TaxID=316456 RepID=UPI0034DD4BEC
MLHPSSSIWLLFLQNSSRDSIDSFFGAVDIPFDCEFVVATVHGLLIELWEVFRVSRDHSLEVSRWGNWSKKHGLQYPSISLYRRRNNLRGLVFAAFGINYQPFTMIDETFQPRGFTPDIIRELSESLNFSYVIHVMDNFGVKENGSWSGAVGMLINGAVNFSVSCIQMTVPRCEDIDFTTPIVNTRYTIYIRTPYSTDTTWSTYLSPYHLTVWITIAVVIILCASLVALLQRLTPGYPHYNLSESLLCFWGSFWAQGHYRTPQQWSARWIHWTSFMTGVFILSLYSANFVSFLTVPKVVLPFRNMRGILEDSTYSFGLLGYVSLFQTFQDSNDEVMSRMFSESLLPKRKSLPTSVLSGFHRMCKEKFAFMTIHYDAITLQENITCEFTELPEDSLPVLLAIPLPKRCPYKGIINFMLQQLKQSGVQHKRQEKWLTGRSQSSTHVLRSVHIQDVLTLFYVCIGGVMFSVTIFLAELCISRTIW